MEKDRIVIEPNPYIEPVSSVNSRQVDIPKAVDKIRRENLDPDLSDSSLSDKNNPR
jgi:hypothetical protein